MSKHESAKTTRKRRHQRNDLTDLRVPGVAGVCSYISGIVLPVMGEPYG